MCFQNRAMSRFVSRVACVFILMTLTLTRAANAGLLNAMEASILVQSTATDTDAMFLGIFAGQPFPRQTLNYDSTGTATAWSGVLSGMFQGTALSATYLGDLSSYASSGAVSWTSAGSYGTENWSGSGTITITDTSARTFQVALQATLDVGSNTASIDYVIPGVVRGDRIMFPGEAGTGTMTVNGQDPDDPVDYSFKEYHKYYYVAGSSDTVFAGNRFDPPRTGLESDNGWIVPADQVTANSFVFESRISMFTVPEPASVVLMSSGVLGLILLRKKGKAGR